MDNTESADSEGGAPEVLRGDPRRRASAAVRGFMYQFWRTVQAWIELEPEDVLFVEGAEDFDVISAGEATAVQIKDNRASGALTLGNAVAINALNHFWKLKADNRGLRVRFKFITTADPGWEKKGPPDRKAVEIWNLCQESSISSCTADVESLRQVLLGQENVDGSLRQFLETAPVEIVKERLIDPVEWLHNQPALEGVEAIVVGRLVMLGESRSLSARDAEALARQLYMMVQRAATARSPQRLDFLAFSKELDRATIIEVPRESLQQHGKFVEVIGQWVAATAKIGAGLLRVMEGPGTFAVPVVARSVWRRQHLIDRVRSALTGGMAYLDGGVGIGKTTLLRQAIEPGQEVFWAQLRGRPDLEVAGMCSVLVHHVATAEGRPVVVLDDLNPEDDPRALERELGRLTAVIRSRAGALAISAYRPAGPRLTSILGLENEGRISVPAFQDEEVAAYLAGAGCPVERVCVLSRLVWLHTGGHPQLVAARVSALRKEGFPQPAPEDILAQPKDIRDARTEALATVRSVLPEDARSMLYRLSLVVPAFRRTHALRIGSGSPGASRPGEAFERLAGPWLEEVAPDHFKVSALVSMAGEQALTPDHVKQLHGDIATAFLAERVMTPSEFGGVMVHALAGEAEEQLAIAAQLFLTASQEIKKTLAREMPWMAGAGVDPGTLLPVSDRAARQFVRLMQLDVAALVSPQRLDALVRATEADFAAQSDDLAEILPRLLYLSKLLICTDLRMAPRTIIACVLEVERLAGKAGRHGEHFLGGGERLSRGGRTLSLGDLFVVSLVPRIRTSEDIQALVIAFDALGESDRTLLLNCFGSEDGELRILFLAPWVSLGSDDRRGFREYAQALAEALSAGRRWKHAAWMRGAARARSAVLDEMLGRREEAETLLADVAAEVGWSFSLEDQLAGIAFNYQDDARALEIWERILPRWTSDRLLHDSQPVFGTRHAAISAARLGRWDQAAALFSQAWKRAERFSMHAWRLGLLGDRGYALWQTGDRKAAIRVFAKAVSDLEKLPNKPESFSEYAVQKLVGHVLSHLTDPNKVLEIRPGMCSDLKPDERIRELPPTPPAFLWLFLGSLAELAGEVGLAKHYADKHRDVPFAFLRAMAARESLHRIIRSRKLAGIFEAAVKVAEGMEQARERERQGLQPAEPDPPGLKGELTERSVGTYIRPALCAAILQAKVLGEDIATLVEGWRTEAGSAQSALRDELDVWLRYAVAGSAELGSALRDTESTPELRATAAVFLVGRDDTGPDDALYAEAVILVSAAAYTIVRDAAGASFDRLVRKDWRRLCERRFLLRNPGLYVGAIRQACESPTTGWSAAARIVLTAAPTTQLNLPETMRAALEALANGSVEAPAPT